MGEGKREGDARVRARARVRVRATRVDEDVVVVQERLKPWDNADDPVMDDLVFDGLVEDRVRSAADVKSRGDLGFTSQERLRVS